jgi:uncharacterized protein YyaL (SSP411 family)
LIALDLLLGPTSEIVFIGDVSTEPTQSLLTDFRRRFIPRHVLVAHAPNKPIPKLLEPLLAGKTEPSQLEPRVFICEDFACQAPAVGATAIQHAWDRL